MQIQNEQWLSLVEIGHMYNISPSRVSILATRHKLEVKRDPLDTRKKLVKLADFQKAVGK